MLVTRYSNSKALNYYRKEKEGEKSYGLPKLGTLWSQTLKPNSSKKDLPYQSLPSEFFWEEVRC